MCRTRRDATARSTVKLGHPPRRTRTPGGGVGQYRRGLPPAVPWLTAEILPAAAITPSDVMGMLGDAERCVAWALIEESQR